MQKANDKKNRLLTFLVQFALRHVPSKRNRGTRMSTGEVNGLLKQKAIHINGKANWKWDDEIPFPITDLVLFPNGRNKITIK